MFTNAHDGRGRSTPTQARPIHPTAVVVDSDAFSSRRVQAALRHGFAVTFADGEVQGFKAALSVNPDIIIVGMPAAPEERVRRSRRMLIARLRADCRFDATPILALVPSASEGVRALQPKFGAQDYCLKPVQATELLVRARNLVKARKNQDGLQPARPSGGQADGTGTSEVMRQRHSVKEYERSRIAGELHDELGQTLAFLKMEVHRLQWDPACTATMHARVAEVSQLIDSAITSTRRIVSGLRPPLLQQFGITEALRSLVEEFAAKTSMRCMLSCDLPPDGASADVSLALYRIAQEALTNAAKHSRAGNVMVALRREGNDIAMAVTDDGRGLGRCALRAPGEGQGILGMQARILALGGEIQFRSALPPGAGLTVWLRVPASRPASGPGGSGTGFSGDGGGR